MSKNKPDAWIYIKLYHIVGINLKVKLIFVKYVPNILYEDMFTYYNSLHHVHIRVFSENRKSESVVKLKFSWKN